MFGVIFLLAAVFFGFFEVRYMISGKTTTATITDVRSEERRGRRGRRYNVDVCYFNYEDEESGLQGGKCDLHGVPVVIGEDSEIEYIPGTESARLKGAGDLGLVGIFGGLGLVGLFVGVMMSRGGEATA